LGIQSPSIGQPFSQTDPQNFGHEDILRKQQKRRLKQTVQQKKQNEPVPGTEFEVLNHLNYRNPEAIDRQTKSCVCLAVVFRFQKWGYFPFI
jgi:Rps23 Pro-64 3,4-dihydroxylase Tpa1-like proline 4-hydroxylase